MTKLITDFSNINTLKIQSKRIQAAFNDLFISSPITPVVTRCSPSQWSMPCIYMGSGLQKLVFTSLFGTLHYNLSNLFHLKVLSKIYQKIIYIHLFSDYEMKYTIQKK